MIERECYCVLEHRFDRTPDGADLMETMFAHPFWRSYRGVFDHVYPVCAIARAREVPKAESGWERPMVRNKNKGSNRTLHVGGGMMHVLQQIDHEQYAIKCVGEAAQIPDHENEIRSPASLGILDSRYRQPSNLALLLLEERI